MSEEKPEILLENPLKEGKKEEYSTEKNRDSEKPLYPCDYVCCRPGSKSDKGLSLEKTPQVGYAKHIKLVTGEYHEERKGKRQKKKFNPETFEPNEYHWEPVNGFLNFKTYEFRNFKSCCKVHLEDNSVWAEVLDPEDIDTEIVEELMHNHLEAKNCYEEGNLIYCMLPIQFHVYKEKIHASMDK